jgi:NAD(P)H-nitrite reductase large subunit
VEEAKMINLHLKNHGIDLHLSTELKEIVPGPDGRVEGIITKENKLIPCQFVGLTVGVHPNIEFMRKSKIETNYGVLVNNYLETNIADIYAAGDCAEILVTDPNKQNRVEQLWYTGRMQAEALAKTICGERTKYERGVWFNSAKFFDIEYQTYGFVSNIPRKGESSFYWENQEEMCCIRFVYNTESRAIKGINVFGMRLSQYVCQNWIREGKKIDYVIQHLEQAHFDPEFYRRYYDQISAMFVLEDQSGLAEAP